MEWKHTLADLDRFLSSSERLHAVWPRHSHILSASGSHVGEGYTCKCRRETLTKAAVSRLIACIPYFLKKTGFYAFRSPLCRQASWSRSISGRHPHPWGSNWLFPRRHSTFDGWPADTEANRLPCGSTSAEPHAWQGQTWVNSPFRFDLSSPWMRACLKPLQIFTQADTPLKKWLLRLAFSKKTAELNQGVVRRDTIWDRLIFRKVQVNIHS